MGSYSVLWGAKILGLVLSLSLSLSFFIFIVVLTDRSMRPEHRRLLVMWCYRRGYGCRSCRSVSYLSFLGWVSRMT